NNGQLARSGHKKPGFEGGQMPLYRRLPKRGFKNRNTKEIIAINVDVLNRFEDGAEVTAESLLASGAISKIANGVKIHGNGELTKKLNVKVNAVSETAKSKIEAAGGTVEVI
ncbi:50S ribosomal protein L15, partial [Anaerosalibacter bizertensis]|nr:50S ribosomal protein L15 [Anaerosalibacter bizertensis]